MSSTKSNRAASPSPASAIRITSSRRNSPSRRFIGSPPQEKRGGRTAPCGGAAFWAGLGGGGAAGVVGDRGAAGVERRQDGAQAVAALGVREQMPAIAKAGIVVLATFVGMPEIEERLRDRPAGARENLPAELDQPCRAVRLDEISAQRRTGFAI